MIYNTDTESGDNMNSLTEYVKKFGSFRFGNMGMTEADNAVFCRLAYLELARFTGKTLGEAAEEYPLPENANDILKDTVYLLREAGKTIRFGYITVENCREITSNNLETAFYAVTFAVDIDTFFIAFRGTDDKILSFYDDAKLAYSFPIASQTTAMGYVTERLSEHNGNFFLGGHSKGGNQALFAYMFLRDDEKSRILRVYNNDGPGFPQEIADILFTPANCEKVYNLLPEDSIIGRMLTDGGKIKIVKSTASGVAQHNMFTWELNGSAFKAVKRFSALSEYMEDTLTQSLETLPPERMQSAAAAIFEIAKNSGIKSVKDINVKNIKNILPAVAELKKLVDESNDDIPVIVRILAKSLVDSASVEKIIGHSMPDINDTINTISNKIQTRKLN